MQAIKKPKQTIELLEKAEEINNAIKDVGQGKRVNIKKFPDLDPEILFGQTKEKR